MGFSLRRLFPAHNPADGRFGYAILGTGHGAEKMCEALASSKTARVAAIVSSTREKAAGFGRPWGVTAACTYDDLGALALDPAIDAVYIALPVALHRRFAERAAAAGKHVLCEKPLASTAADAHAMVQASAAANRLLMVGYRLDYDPMHAEASRLIHGGALGVVQHVRANFGIVAKGGWRFDPALAGGGSLWDVGIYPIHALHTLFGDLKLLAAHIQTNASGLELDARIQGVIEGNAGFTCHSSYLEREPDVLAVRGSLGVLTLRHAFDYKRTELEFLPRRGDPIHLTDSKQNPSLFQLEAEHLADCVREGTDLRSPGQSGLRDLRFLEQVMEFASRTEAKK